MQSNASDLKPLQVPEREAARILNLHPKTLFNRRQAKKIAFVRDGNRIMYRLEELDRYSRSLEVPAVITG
jgi:hypothetical protein